MACNCSLSQSEMLTRTRGYLALVGELVDFLAADALESSQLISKYPTFSNANVPHHISVVSKAELHTLPKEKLTDLRINTGHVTPLGVGGNPGSGVFFLVVVWSAGQNFRKRLGLPPKQFHITLSKFDDHDMDKGVDSLLYGEFPRVPSLELLDHLAFTFHIFGDYERSRTYALDHCQAYPESERGFIRLADAALHLQEYKLAMLSYACAFGRSDDPKLRDHCIKKMITCSKETEWGCIVLEREAFSVPDAVMQQITVPWDAELLLAISEVNTIPTLRIESRERLYIPSPTGLLSYKLPRFFRWLVPFHLAIMSTPRNAEDVEILASPHVGIRHVLTLTEETPLDQSWFTGNAVSNTFLPIPNYHPPSIEQMDLILRLLQDINNLPLLIHCGAGKGRAGTVAACYLVAYGFQKPREGLTYPTMSSNEAVAALRAIRPGSIETSKQEEFVAKFAGTIWKRQSILSDLVSEPSPCPFVVEGTLKNRDHDLVVLVGLPGSGKSWFSNALLSRNSSGWIHISQDESGSRSSCENEIGHEPGEKPVLLDRCNTSAEDRKTWLKLAHWATQPICVWFDFDVEVCTSRAQNRAGHPTLPPGSRVRNAINQMDKIFNKPSFKEGFKAIVIVRSFAASQELVMRLSPPVVLFKFPRTAHLINLGAVSDDDIMATGPHMENSVGAHVVITEKVDGANMGFSLSSDRSSIVVQNRSHYINPSSHEQFKKLGLWIDEHRSGLYQVLHRDVYFPERYILFGEWLAATHSIAYTRLPDRFLAYDIYDRSTSTWADRKTLSALLQGTDITMVPLLHEDAGLPSRQDLTSMIQRTSKFYDGPVEGIYVKIERYGRVLSRGKVVRGDFIAGNEHWSKGILRLNALQLEDNLGIT